jgi:hypothetical protein
MVARQENKEGLEGDPFMSAPGASATSDAVEVAAAHWLDESSLTRRMEGDVECGPPAVAKFKGGGPNPTYGLEAASGAFALRRKPASSPDAQGWGRSFPQVVASRAMEETR